LKSEFPDARGFSPRNILYMKHFYEFYVDADVKLRNAVAVLPWGRHLLILSFRVRIGIDEESRIFAKK